MAANVGGIDRIIRIVAGIVIIVLGVAYESWWGIIGIVPLATGLFRWCGLYPLLGISTCKAPLPEQPASEAPAPEAAASQPAAPPAGETQDSQQ